MLGFENRVLRAYLSHISDFIPEIFEIRTINIYCPLVNSNIVNENTHSDIIYSCPLDYSKIGASTVEKPNSILYFPLTTYEFMYLKVDIRDQNEKHVAFQELVEMNLIIRLIK